MMFGIKSVIKAYRVEEEDRRDRLVPKFLVEARRAELMRLPHSVLQVELREGLREVFQGPYRLPAPLAEVLVAHVADPLIDNSFEPLLSSWERDSRQDLLLNYGGSGAWERQMIRKDITAQVGIVTSKYVRDLEVLFLAMK